MSTPIPTDRREAVGLALLLAATFLIRAIHPGQPIVENYVGRQIPTAMVARNLQRGSGFFRPELDTGPFPNRFLVEPPIYAQVVAGLSRAARLELEPTGRLVSALAVMLGAWGLWGLVRRREGPDVAALAVTAFAVLPVMVRFGRVFQPDALMVGALLVGLRGWDEWAVRERGGRAWSILGGIALGLALAIKVIVVWALIPFAVIAGARWSLARRLVVAGLMLVPALAWYGLAWSVLRRPDVGSAASADNAAIWLGSIGPMAWLDPATWRAVGRAVVVGAFGPVGFGLTVAGWMLGGRIDPVWRAWGLGVGLAVIGLAAKWHHGYYWMTVAPLAATGIGRAIAVVGRRCGVGVAGAVGMGFLGLSLWQAAATWRTPAAWADLPALIRVIDENSAPDEMVIAPEAVLYYADRRGCRLEFDPAAARRAAGEWGAALPEPVGPLSLVDFYQGQAGWFAPGVGRGGGTGPRIGIPGIRRCVADAGPTAGDPARAAWRAAIRARPGAVILLDEPGAFVAQIY